MYHVIGLMIFAASINLRLKIDDKKEVMIDVSISVVSLSLSLSF